MYSTPQLARPPTALAWTLLIILFTDNEFPAKRTRVHVLYQSLDYFPRAQHKYKTDQLILHFINMSEVQVNKSPTDQPEANEYSEYSDNSN